MSEPIVLVDSSDIREGKLDELRKAINDLVEFVEASEPARSPTTCISTRPAPG